MLGVHSRRLFRLIPLNLLLLVILLIVIVYGLWLTYDRVVRHRSARKRAAAGEPLSPSSPQAGKARS